MKFIDQENFWYLTEGLTYESKDLKVLDSVLEGLNTKINLIDRIIQGNRTDGFANKVNSLDGQFIFDLDKLLTASNNELTVAHVKQKTNEISLPTCVHLNTHSPTLNVPQRIEIPLKYILKGLPKLSGTHMVYLHAIQIQNGNTFSYYGRTKRGWMKRYIEHVKLAMKGSTRKFPDLFGRAIKARYDQLNSGVVDENLPVYTGSYHVVCAAGLDIETAKITERYLIKKHGLNEHSGLNMI